MAIIISSGVVSGGLTVSRNTMEVYGSAVETTLKSTTASLR